MKHKGALVFFGWCLLTFISGQSFAQKVPCPPKTSQRPLRLVFITCVVHAKFFGPVKKGMHDAAQMLGVHADFIGTEGVDVQAQAALVRKAVEDGYDGIALNIIDPTAFDQVIQEAIDKGVPVVGFNVDDSSTPNARLSCVNQRFREAGRKLVRHVLKDIPKGSHVLLTMHDRGVSALDDRLLGEQDVLKTKDVHWTVLVTGNDSKKGAEVIARFLKQHPNVHIVFGTGQADTEAAGLALKQAFPNDHTRWAAGFDLSPTTLQLIKEGFIRCTVDQQPYVQGFYPVVQLTLYLRYGIMPSDMDAGANIIDKNSVDRVMMLSKCLYR